MFESQTLQQMNVVQFYIQMICTQNRFDILNNSALQFFGGISKIIQLIFFKCYKIHETKTSICFTSKMSFISVAFHKSIKGFCLKSCSFNISFSWIFAIK